MSRYGITYEEVERVAENLLQQGRNPTMEGIRAELGAGSFTTINKHLHTWRAKKLVSTAKEAKEGSEKVVSTNEVSQAVNSIWEQLNTQAQEKIEKINRESEEKITALAQENQLLQQEKEELFKGLEETKIKNNHLETDLTLLKKELAEERSKRAVAEEKARSDSQALTMTTTNHEKHVLDLKNTQGLAIKQLKEFYEQKNTYLLNDLNDLKHMLENQRTDFMVKLDELKTAKEKIEKSYFKIENELKNQIMQTNTLKEQKSLLETDSKVTLQQKQELEKANIVLKTQLDQKEKIAVESKEQLSNLQRKYEASTEELGKLKMQVEYMQNKLKTILHSNKKSKENAYN